MKASYRPPVDKLLTIGPSEVMRPEDWPNYLEMGLGPEHIDDLILMATDDDLHEEYEDSPGAWAPVHAWRALGQLRAQEAIKPLMDLFELLSDDDWAMEELPVVYSMIGPAAIPALTAYLVDELHEETASITAITSLEKIGSRWPEARAESVASLTKSLELFQENEPDVNGFLIYSLAQLKAVEAAPLMERAFAAKKVDLLIMGDWDDVQIELGLKEPEEKQPSRPLGGFFSPLLNSSGSGSNLPGSAKPGQSGHTGKKAKHKQAKESRKKNRKSK